MKKKIFAVLAMSLVFAAMAFPAYATEGDISGAMTTAFGTIASDAMSLIAAVIPVALPILGAVVLVTIGIRMFRKITGR